MVIVKVKQKVLFKVNYFYKKYLGKYNRKDSYPFVSGDSFRKKCLIEGLDDIALTLKKSHQILVLTVLN